MKPQTDISVFSQLDIRTGTIISARENRKARKPAYILEIDFGEIIGIKTTSAQLTKNYQIDDLINLQITAVINFPSLRIAGVKSEVLVLGSVGENNDITLLSPVSGVENGLEIG